MSLTKLNYFEDQISKFVEEDRQESKSYGEMAAFQDEITKEFLTWVKEDNNIYYSDVEVITEWLSELKENAMDYINIEAYYNMMSELLEDKISEYEDLLEDEDRREEWAKDYADKHGLDCDYEYFNISEIDIFYNTPSDLLDAMRGEFYHGEDYFKIGTYGLEFSDYGTDWQEVFDAFEVKRYVQNGYLKNTDDVVDLGSDITDLEEALDLINDIR